MGDPCKVEPMVREQNDPGTPEQIVDRCSLEYPLWPGWLLCHSSSILWRSEAVGSVAYR